MKYVREIINILKQSVFADGYSIYKQIQNANMADIRKSISYLQQKKIIYVTGHRKSSRTGVRIPIYSLVKKHAHSNTPHNIDSLDTDHLLAGTISERVVEYGFLARNLQPHKINMRILDVGSGPSAVTNALSSFGNNKKWDVFGIDIAKELPKLFKEGKEKSPVVLLRMDARMIGFRDEVFDKVICISTIEHIGMPATHHLVSEYDALGDVTALSEIFRILKKGGKAILTIPYEDKNIHGYIREHRIYNSSMLARLITRFHVKKKEYYIYVDGKWKGCRNKDIASESRLFADLEVPQYLHSRICLCLLLERK
ncbi:MAG: class I SAM-dependent methyltransferase [Candidatus Nitrosopolaris sp.]